MAMSMNRFLGLACIAFALCCLSAAARADVVTVLSSDVTQVGQPVILNYRFVNTAMPEDMPRPAIAVDGLDIRYNGMQTQNSFSWNFGGGGNRSDTQSAFEFMYVVTPDRPGDFTIPGFDVRAGGKRIRTKPVKLRVIGGGSYAPQVPTIPAPQPFAPPGPPQRVPSRQPSPQMPQGDDDARAYYGEVVMGAKQAYVGEVIPVELRFYFRADRQFDNLQRPNFGGEGFTAAPLSEPEQTEQEIGGMPYNVVTFRSAITPVKSGEIEIPPAAMEGRMVTQQAPAGLDPFFDQFFQNMPGAGRAENIKARTNRRKLEVLSLPKEGRPENFSGAVGQFSMDAKASPKTAAAGEPVTLQLAISGRGNFDAMAAPELTGEEGWRTYTPKSSFAPEDSRGFGKTSGTKTFEFSLIARKDQTQTPGAEFAYFDPREKKYVTLTADPVAVRAEGAGASAGGTEPDQTKSSAAAAVATPAPRQPDQKPAAPEASDIASSAQGLAKHAAGFRPWVRQPWFLALNLLLLLAALVSIPLFVWARRRSMKSALVSELETTLRRAKVGWQNTGERDVFYTAAAHFVLARLALWDNKPLAQVDADEALMRRVPDPVERREILSVLAKHDELKYGGGGTGALDPKERERVVAALEKFSASHA